MNNLLQREAIAFLIDDEQEYDLIVDGDAWFDRHGNCGDGIYIKGGNDRLARNRANKHFSSIDSFETCGVGNLVSAARPAQASNLFSICGAVMCTQITCHMLIGNVLDLDVRMNFEGYDVQVVWDYWWWTLDRGRCLAKPWGLARICTWANELRDEGRLKLARVLQAVQIKLAEAHTKTQKRLTPKKVNFSA
jgi:hypothetical protein